MTMPSDQTRAAILDAAERLYADRGFGDVTLRDIVAAAGVNLAAVNYHFGSKDELIAEVGLRRLVRPWPIDRRVLPMRGFGTVVTGTLISGTVKKDDELEVFPSGQRARVRGVQVHGKQAEQAVAGQRTALNLAGTAMEQLARGMTLAPTETFKSTSRVDVELSAVEREAA